MAAARTPEEELFLAAKGGNLEKVQELIDAGSDIDEPGAGNETPFSIAFKHRHFDVARALAEAGVDINTEFGWARMPLLIELTRSGQAPMFPEGARNMLNRGQGFAMLPGTVDDVLRFLGFEGADPDITDDQGNTPLLHATRAQNLEMINVLINAGADVNIGNNAGETPLGMAVFHQNRGIFTRLLEAGAEIGEMDGDILVRAANYDDLFFAEQLIERVEDINNLFFVENEEGEPLIHAAIRMSEIPGIRFLIANGVNLERRDEENRTPLMVAIEDRPDLIEFLIQNGADVQAVALNGQTIIENARNHVYAAEINALIIRTDAWLRRRAAVALLRGGRRTRKRRSSRRKSRRSERK